jgi:hypothetical protein
VAVALLPVAVVLHPETVAAAPPPVVVVLIPVVVALVILRPIAARPVSLLARLMKVILLRASAA